MANRKLVQVKKVRSTFVDTTTYTYGDYPLTHVSYGPRHYRWRVSAGHKWDDLRGSTAATIIPAIKGREANGY